MNDGEPYRGELIIADPTHAGGVVIRRDGDALKVLLVTARRQHGLWVFPKGHIEAGEGPEQAAVREVFEEAGVVAAVVRPIGATEFRNARGPVRSQFYLMAFESELTTPGEGRRRHWFTPDEARRALVYEDARLLVQRAFDDG